MLHPTSRPAAGAAAGTDPGPTLDDRFAIIQRVARVGFWEMRVSDRHLQVSQEMRILFGVPPDAPAPDFGAMMACVPPDDRGRVEAELTHAMVHGIPLDLDHRVLRPDGEIRHRLRLLIDALAPVRDN